MKANIIAFAVCVAGIMGMMLVAHFFPLQPNTANADLLAKEAVHLERYRQAVATAARYQMQAEAMQATIKEFKKKTQHEKIRMVVVADSIAQQPIEGTGNYFVSSLTTFANHYYFAE